MQVNLGFAEQVESWKLRSKFFPSKIGGCPSWLNLELLPSGKDVQCGKCQKALIFLCQVYAPITSKEDCFHRTLFVFICKDGKCSSLNTSGNMQVFRCQLPRINKYYCADPPKEEEETCSIPDVSMFTRICRVCGSYGSKVCGSCKLVSYCSRDHQFLDWKHGHKSECRQKELISIWGEASKALLFPEYEIDIEEEELGSEAEIGCKNESGNEEGTSSNENTNPLHSEFSEEDLMKIAKQETDKEFSKFRSRINEYPKQVLRYQRNGSPLFVSSENKPTYIPNCEYCGGPRTFEFQITPQLLVYLNVDDMDESIDWGTIIIYTCAESCSPSKLVYMKEICFKQDYSQV